MDDWNPSFIRSVTDRDGDLNYSMMLDAVSKMHGWGEVYVEDGPGTILGGTLPVTNYKVKKPEIPPKRHPIVRAPRRNYPKKIIYNNPATIVFWEDGSKTVVKAMEGTEFNEYYGFVCALAKKLYGTNSAINHVIENAAK